MLKKGFSKKISLIFSLILSLAMILSVFTVPMTASAVEVPVWDGNLSGRDYSFTGTGTEADPYVITTAEQLYTAAVNNGPTQSPENNKYKGPNVYWTLANDIYLNDVTDPNWKTNSPNVWYNSSTAYINTYTTTMGFQGHFDGQGYAIYGMYWDAAGINADHNMMGLFCALSGDGTTVKNINFKETYVGSYNSMCYVGTVAAFVGKGAKVSISNCVADETNDFSGLTGALAGGFIGGVHEAYLTVTNCGSAVKFNNLGIPAGRGGGIVADTNAWAAKGLVIKNSYSVAAFTTNIAAAINKAAISDGTLYSTQAYWKTQGVNLSVVAENDMKDAAAAIGMPDLDWSIWSRRGEGVPVIKGSVIDTDSEKIFAGDIVNLRKVILGCARMADVLADVNKDGNVNLLDLVRIKILCAE